jgi:hypothetical protein
MKISGEDERLSNKSDDEVSIFGELIKYAPR